MLPTYSPEQVRHWADIHPPRHPPRRRFAIIGRQMHDFTTSAPKGARKELAPSATAKFISPLLQQPITEQDAKHAYRRIKHALSTRTIGPPDAAKPCASIWLDAGNVDAVSIVHCFCHVVPFLAFPFLDRPSMCRGSSNLTARGVPRSGITSATNAAAEAPRRAADRATGYLQDRTLQFACTRSE